MSGQPSHKQEITATKKATKGVRTASKNSKKVGKQVVKEPVQLDDEPRTTNLTCDICFDEKDFSLFHDGKLAPACKHASTLCTECVTSGVLAQLSGKQWEAIECVLCKVVLPSNTLKQYLSPANFQRYNDYISTYHISKARLYMPCQHPTCGAAQIHYGASRNPQMTCHKCGNMTCYTCKVPWHRGRSCQAFKKAKQAAALEAQLNALPEQERSQFTIRTTTNICPGCKAPVERWKGCPNMTCVCGKNFVWQDPSRNFEIVKEPPQVQGLP